MVKANKGHLLVWEREGQEFVLGRIWCSDTAAGEFSRAPLPLSTTSCKTDGLEPTHVQAPCRFSPCSGTLGRGKQQVNLKGRQ